MTKTIGKTSRGLYGGINPRELAAYPLPEAAQYLRMPVSTLRDWVVGRHRAKPGRKSFRPVIEIPDRQDLVLSYMNLIEAHVLRSMRFSHQIKLVRVRAAIEYLQEQFNSRHPLADHDFLTDGLDLLIESFGKLVNVSRYGQGEFPNVVKAFLRRIERDPNGLPLVLYPMPSYERAASDPHQVQPRPVSLNPIVSFGQPVIPGTGIKAEVLFDRWSAGETIGELSEDYKVESSKIEAAIQWFATKQRRAA